MLDAHLVALIQSNSRFLWLESKRHVAYLFILSLRWAHIKGLITIKQQRNSSTKLGCNMKLHETVDGVVFEVQVKPNMKQFQLELDADKLVALCSSAPVKGKVNKELLKQFSRLLGGHVELVSGFTSRQKRFIVTGIKVEKVEQILTSACDTR
jgi:uncharacterized protein (TIGR00251 family)